MNYIKQLEEDRKNLANKVANIMIELSDFQAFLQTSPKFRNEPNQERKDWISTGDVINRLQEIKNLI
jgi:hypothetical protein